jgi:hypothetical protein
MMVCLQECLFSKDLLCRNVKSLYIRFRWEERVAGEEQSFLKFSGYMLAKKIPDIYNTDYGGLMIRVRKRARS